MAVEKFISWWRRSGHRSPSVAEAACKRGGEVHKVALEDAIEHPARTDIDILALDDELKELAEMDPQQCRVVELKFFAGLSNEDAAEVLGISASTVKRDWLTARLWLYRELDRSSKH